jgi:predicted small metal-binding protein
VGNRVIRCDCGFEAIGATDDDLLSEAQGHARDVHGSEVAADVLLALARPRRKEG